MENCILKQVNFSVDDNALFEFGSMQFVTDRENVKLTITSSDSVIRAKNGTFVVSGSVTPVSEYTLSGNQAVITIPNTGTIIEISDKYNITYFECLPLDTEYVKFLTGCTILVIQAGGNIEDIKYNKNLRTLNIDNSTIAGNISALEELDNLVDFYASVNNQLLIGDISVLATKRALGSCYTNGSNITGSIEDFVAKQIVAKGSTSGYVIGSFNVDNITFGNLSGEVIRHLEWSGNNHIIGYNDTNKTNATKVYANGATQQEIADWENAGKSVVIVTGTKPYYIGSGTEYNDVVNDSCKQNIKASPAGTYNVTINNNGDYVWFVVPNSMTINKVTMSGFNFPIESPQIVQIEGNTYKAYKTSNTYDAGIITIVIS